MKYYLLLFYPIIALLITFWGCKKAPKGEFCDSFLSRDNSKRLQGIFCIFIILHHITQSITGYGQTYKGPVTILSSMGILFTAIFFFFSGYGLILSVYNKPGYLDNFLSHRLPIILVPFYTANIVFMLVRLFIFHTPTTNSDILKCLTGLYLLNGNGWYIVEIFWLYLIFYILFLCFRKKDSALIFLCLATLFIIFIGYKSGHDYEHVGDLWFKGEWWYNSTITFIMGALFARFKNVITSFFKRHYFLLLTLTAVLFIPAFIIEEKIRLTLGYYTEALTIDGVNSKLITLIAQSILCLIFTLLILLISLKIEINNKVLSSLSIISTDLFLIHNLFTAKVFNFTDIPDFFHFAIVLGCSIPAAIIMHFINKPLISLFQRITKKKKKEKIYRKKNYKKIAIITVIIFAVLTGLALLYYKVIRPSFDYKTERMDLLSAETGDEVNFGRFETNYLIPGKEKLTWIVLEKNDNELLLITKEGIASSAYLHAHKETTWSGSDLCSYLNDTLYNQIFNMYEKDFIVADKETKDVLSLLSVKEVSLYFNDEKSRQLTLTQVAEKNGANINTYSKVNDWDYKDFRTTWWWLRGDETPSITAPIVTVDGTIELDKKYVNRPNGTIRPTVRICVP